MPIVKYIPIHQSPKRFIRYILQNGKTDFLKYATGLNCTADVEACYREMEATFELTSDERFYKKSLTGADGEKRQREKIRLHHYIQSFAPGEADPELAHRIGVEWAKKVFGNNHQVMVTTHIDRGHLHNHFAVAAYDLDGKAWYANKKTLKHCRDISDKIALEYGLSIIEKPKYRTNHKYGEWLARKTGTSWKQKLCDDIDRLILQENVKSVSDLVNELRGLGYEVNHGKYISIKAVKNRKAIRSFRLGNGYAIEELQYRIDNKNQEMPLSEAMRYEGIQREYALCLRELQIMVYRKSENPVQADYRTLRKNADLLTYLCEKKICSLSDFENTVNCAAEKYDEAVRRKKELEKQIELEERISADAARYLELTSIDFPTVAVMQELEKYEYLSDCDIRSETDIEAHREKLSCLKSEFSEIDEKIEAAEIEKKTAAGNYSVYLGQMKSDYEVILEKMKRERGEREAAEKNRKTEEREAELNENVRGGDFVRRVVR